jgi:hypothetical protein
MKNKNRKKWYFLKKSKKLISALLLGSMLTLGSTSVFAKAPDTNVNKNRQGNFANY